MKQITKSVAISVTGMASHNPSMPIHWGRKINAGSKSRNPLRKTNSVAFLIF
jgi:hypothetical protein